MSSIFKVLLLGIVLVLANVTSTYCLLPYRKGDEGVSGLPGACHTKCTTSCTSGASVILKEVTSCSKGLSVVKSLNAVVNGAVKTLEVLKSGQKSVGDLSKEENSNLYLYLLYKTTFCSASSLTVEDLEVVQGEPGQKGEMGERGVTGMVGPPGTPGQNGRAGEKGEKGEKGDIGMQGIPGMVGQKGEKGEPGFEGMVGEPGPIGPVGTIGPSGLKGPPGLRGSKGTKGDAGTSGLTYINWGMEICPPDTTTLYKGTAVQTPGGNMQCLQTQLQFSSHNIPALHISKLRSLRYTNYQYKQRPINCAVCFVLNRSAKFVNMGTKSCPLNWTKEYQGSMTTLHPAGHSESVCMNEWMLSQIHWSSNTLNSLNVMGPKCNSSNCEKEMVTCALCTH